MNAQTQTLDQTQTVAPGAETPATSANDKRMSDLMRQVGQLGADAALGKDSLPKLAHAVVRAAADGIIDMETKYKSTSGDKKECDVAQHIYEKYVTSEGKKAIHEHTTGGFKANVSKVRQLVQMGAMTAIDAVEVMQAAFKAREDIAEKAGKENIKIKLKSAYPFYVDVAREQLKSDKPLTKEELESLAVKDEPNAKTLEGELKRALTIIEGLVTGENKDKIKDDNELTEAAYHAIKERLDALATLRQRDELMQKAAALGLKLA